MSNFSLSKKLQKVCPDSITEDGRAFFINPDYRVILKILRMLEDPEIYDMHKKQLACQWFYKDDIPEDGWEQLLLFVGGGNERTTPVQREFDFEFDAPEIYASFMKSYGMDLLDVPFLHWIKFSALLSALPDDSAFSRKIQLRFMDTSKSADRAKAERLKRAVQLPTRESLTEMVLREQMEDALRNGGDISKFLGR